MSLVSTVNVEELESRVHGLVTKFSDPGYEKLRRSLSWNQLTPQRFPEIVVQVATEQDVVEAVRFARSRQLKVAVRGGGHSFVGFSLRDESILIDLSHLKAVSLDPEKRTAVVQPAVTGRELNSLLAAHGLAFPVGHCPSVPLSGFLLNGGLGWNTNTWGPACLSVESAKLVTADGRLIVANEQQNKELFWAIRGGGPGFFGVITEYSLKLYRAPGAISQSTYFYPLETIEDVASWTAKVAKDLPREVELTLFVSAAPPDLSEAANSGNGFVAILSAVAFVDNGLEATEILQSLEGCPAINQCLKKEIKQPTSFDELLDLGSLLWPPRHRYAADTVWTNSPPAVVLSKVREHFLRAPSQKSLAACVFSTGDAAPAQPDTAFSMVADNLLLCYGIWEQSKDDAANINWHRELIDNLDQFAVGHYVGESDIVSNSARAEASYAQASWQRLQALRQKYDPDQLFHAHF